MIICFLSEMQLIMSKMLIGGKIVFMKVTCSY